MSGVHFVQQCPTCGRRVQVRLELMGRQVNCQHCKARFVGGLEEPTDEVLDRADELLADAEAMRLDDKPIQEMW